MEAYQKKAEAMNEAQADDYRLELAREAMAEISGLATEIQKAFDSGPICSRRASIVAYRWYNPEDDLDEIQQLVRDAEEGRAE